VPNDSIVSNDSKFNSRTDSQPQRKGAAIPPERDQASVYAAHWQDRSGYFTPGIPNTSQAASDVAEAVALRGKVSSLRVGSKGVGKSIRTVA
jgi:hypothetical protein